VVPSLPPIGFFSLPFVTHFEDADEMSDKKRFWLFIVLGASLGLYILLPLRYPLEPSLDHPRAAWTTMVEPTGWNAFWHLAIYLGLTLLYLAILRLTIPSQGEQAAPPRVQIVMILVTWLACSAVLMRTAPGGESHDIFDYVFRGRMMTEYGTNPLVDVPADFDLSTPYTRYLAWRKHVDTYGPVWEASSAAVAISVRQVARWLNWWDKGYPVCPKSPESCRLLMVYLTGYRLLATALTGLAGWLIFSMVTHSRPSLAAPALAAWLLSPMTLLATALGGHNDVIMLVLVLLCCWLLQRKRPYLALAALILAAHVKLTALIWLPACMLWIVSCWGWRRALKIGLFGAVNGLVLSWLLYAPFGGWQSLPRMLHERSEFLANSLWRILKYLLIHQWGWHTESAHQLSVGLPSLLFAIGALLIPLWMFNVLSKRRYSGFITLEEDPKLWQALIVTSMLSLLVGSFWFQHWYVLWIIAPAALLPDSRFTRSVLPWLAFGALSSNVAMDFLLTTATKTSSPILNSSLAVVIIWAPVTLAIAVLALLQWSGKRNALVRARSNQTPLNRQNLSLD
jgi:hypothetical protein